MPLTVLLGGARSGKSTLAMRLAGDGPVTFVATAEARDEEMTMRIARHRAERPEGWTTVEEPVELADAIGRVPARDALIVDCLSLWVSNLMEREVPGIEDVAQSTARTAAARTATTIAVTNEVGMGIVPANALSRRYRDALGAVNAIWADAADDAYLVVAGRTLPLDRHA